MQDGRMNLMRHVSQILPADNPHQSIGYEQPLEKDRTPEISTLMDNLWVKMVEIYGHLWLGYGESPNETWCEALAECTQSDITRGLRALTETEQDKPPSAVTFRRLCLPKKSIYSASLKLFEFEKQITDQGAIERTISVPGILF